jgi:ribosome maturation factor RimP
MESERRGTVRRYVALGFTASRPAKVFSGGVPACLSKGWLTMAQRGGNRAGGRPGSRSGGRTQRPTGSPAGRPPVRDLTAERARLRQVITPVITDAGYYLEGLALSRAGRRYLVRLTVDGDEAINLDAVADVSRLVSKALDEAEESNGELLDGEYELQVSSPGVDRPLTEPRHWRRNVGRLVQVRAGDAGQLTGRVTAAGPDGITLDVDGTAHSFSYDVLGSGKVQLEFNRLAELPEEDVGTDDEFTDVDDEDDDWEEDEE